MKRFVSIWFRHLCTDWFALKQPDLHKKCFVLSTPVHGRMVVAAANALAQKNNIVKDMVVADARAVMPDLVVIDEMPELIDKLLKRLAEWCIRFTPFVAVDPPDGLILDASGCSHLWGGDDQYIQAIGRKLNERGYDVRLAMADTPGVAWSIARYGNDKMVVKPGGHKHAILTLPAQCLRVEQEAVERLHRLGLHRVGQFIDMPRASLLRRFGPQFLKRLDQVQGYENELIQPVEVPEPYQERLPCLDPIATAEGIEYALKELLAKICQRLKGESKGLRNACFKAFRVDGKMAQIEVGTNKPSSHGGHLFRLFQLKIVEIEPGLGIELFVIEAKKVEDIQTYQEKLWNESSGLEDERLFEMLDRVSAKTGAKPKRYLPAEHYWPERSYKVAESLVEEPTIPWSNARLRPLLLYKVPEPIDVTAPIPDYPPMLFRYRGKLHRVVKSDGPERIEQEWWLQHGQHRDYYKVEDEAGNRYWIFRSGHYGEKESKWFMHGIFS